MISQQIFQVYNLINNFQKLPLSRYALFCYYLQLSFCFHLFVCFEWNANIEQKEIRTEQVCKIGFSKYRCRQNYTCKILVGSKGFIDKGERKQFWAERTFRKLYKSGSCKREEGGKGGLDRTAVKFWETYNPKRSLRVPM